MSGPLLIAVLAGVSAASIATFVLFPKIKSAKPKPARMSRYAPKPSTDPDRKTRGRDRPDQEQRSNSLRKSGQRRRGGPPKADENREKRLEQQLLQAGFEVSARKVRTWMTGAGLLACALSYLMTGSWVTSIGLSCLAALVMPRWLIGKLAERRQKRFVLEFPNALDIIVRGVRAGLPVFDTLKIVSSEAGSPVNSEFQKVVDALQIGFPLPEAVSRLNQSMPLSETNFFATVIAIQAQMGSNLAEVLSNLSRVLRARHQLREKIKALSTEATASAAILGSLPIVLAAIMYFISHKYIMTLFTTFGGKLILASAAAWMLVGISVMRSMIKIDI